MAPYDEKSEGSGSGDNIMGQGKDVLFGWLVGRAAADLGLAQALAASEAQRNDQLRRLEQSLIAQIQDLQDHQSPNSSPTFDQLKVEIESFTNRVGSLESATQQASHMHRALQSEIQTLQHQLSNASNVVALDADATDAIQRKFTEQIAALEAKLSAGEDRRTLDSAAESQLADFAARLEKIERLGETEAAAPSPSMEAINETIATLVRQALQPLQVKVSELETRPSGDAQDEGRAIAAVESKLAAIENKMRLESAHVNGERFDQMQAQIQNLTERIHHFSSMPSVAEALATREAEHVRAMKQIEESFAAKLGSLERELNKKIDQGSATREDPARWRNELDILRDSLSRVEAARQGAQREATSDLQRLSQSIEHLMSELASLKLAVQPPADPQAQIDDALSGLERRWVSNFQELRADLASVNQGSTERDAQLNQLHQDLLMLDRRLAHTESSSQQSEDLASHIAKFEQVMTTWRSELSQVQEQLDERQKRDLLARGVADNLGVKIRELQSLVDGKLLDDLQRDTEIERLRGEMKTLSLGSKPVSAGVKPMVPVGNRVSVAGGYPGESVVEPLRTRVVTDPHLEDPFAKDHVTATPPEIDKQTLSDRERSKLLQDRMSADIERVRAELREKSGRWKVRR